MMFCDYGGALYDYLHLYLTQGPAKITACCESACTLALSDPQSCVGPRAVLGFHAASNPGGTWFMRAMMPERIRAWIDAHGGLTPRMIWLHAKDAITLGVRACR